MDKNKILEQVNLKSSCKFELSKPIIDNYLENKNYRAIGYGIYDNDVKHRYCLIIDLPNVQKTKTLTTLLMNPANTFPKGIKDDVLKSVFDQTIRNLIILASELQYSQIIVLNSFAYICSNSKIANDYYDKIYKNSEKENELNKNIIDYIISNTNNILVACGDSVKQDLYKHYIEILKNKNNVYTYAEKLTKKGRPRHLSIQSEQNRNEYKKTLKNRKLYPFTIR